MVTVANLGFDRVGGATLWSAQFYRHSRAQLHEQNKLIQWGLGPAFGSKKLLGVFMTKFALS